MALVIAHAASFLVRNSAFWRISISTGKMLASMTFWQKQKNVVSSKEQQLFISPRQTETPQQNTWIWARFPAVMLDTVQQASFLMDSLGLLRRWSKHGSAEQFKITWDESRGAKDLNAVNEKRPSSTDGRNRGCTWVWMSSPVTMFPTARKAGETTL